MKCRSNHLAIVAVIVGCLAMSGVVSATQIEAISSDFLDSSFTNTGGAFSLGVLTVDDNGDIIVEDIASVQTTFAGGHVLLTTDLFLDNSSGGIADGIFHGGTITLTDNTPSDLLTADIVSMEVIEQDIPGLPDMLVGNGTFVVTGGSLAPDFGALGEIFQLTFNLPGNIDDFANGGTAVADVKLTPIPEPSTCLLFATAGLSVVGWIRRRRVTG